MAGAAEQVGATRAWARAVLAAWGLDASADAVELLVSELVTNAIRHGREPISLRLHHHLRHDLWIEVDDRGPGRPRLRDACATDTSGRGLELVDAVTGAHDGSWGVADHGGTGGKTVFAVLSVPSNAGPLD